MRLRGFPKPAAREFHSPDRKPIFVDTIATKPPSFTNHSSPFGRESHLPPRYEKSAERRMGKPPETRIPTLQPLHGDCGEEDICDIVSTVLREDKWPVRVQARRGVLPPSGGCAGVRSSTSPPDTHHGGMFRDRVTPGRCVMADIEEKPSRSSAESFKSSIRSGIWTPSSSSRSVDLARRTRDAHDGSRSTRSRGQWASDPQPERPVLRRSDDRQRRVCIRHRRADGPACSASAILPTCAPTPSPSVMTGWGPQRPGRGLNCGSRLVVDARCCASTRREAISQGGACKIEGDVGGPNYAK